MEPRKVFESQRKGKNNMDDDKQDCSDSKDREMSRRSSKKVRKKEKQKQKQIQEVESSTDPLEVLGSDIMLKILSNLDARSVALSLLVSRLWQGVTSSDTLWGPKCDELWHEKAHIPRVALAPGLSKLAIYSLAVMDGRRVRIRWEDLCDHAWEFHFGEGVTDYWRDLDPYWTGIGPPMHRYFHPDGSVTADPNDNVWGGNESCCSIFTTLVGDGDGTIREHYVRINRWPRMFVSRKQDWSWKMRSGRFRYHSLPDADKKEGTGPPFPDQ